jgi:hypothetical protein
MSLNARHELIQSIAQRYHEASKADKERILDELVAATGYHRKSATRLLNNPPAKPSPLSPRRRTRLYDDDVSIALVTLWEAADRICSKRLVPFLPELIEALERHGHLHLEASVRQRLRSISPATVDRLLHQVRYGSAAGGISTTRPGSLLKHQIPVRTFADWDDLKPGFFEADLVAHCGTVNAGSYLNTLTMTDVETGWTECLALLVREQDLVVKAIDAARRLIPFPMLGLDTDNGKEFINYTLLEYCRRESITFTRSRPYKKNDQCHVEQKNGSIVRRVVGYDRFEGIEACRILSLLYQRLRLYVNFFQPSLKLFAKERFGSRVVKKYDQAQTPCQRVQASDAVEESVKSAMRHQYLQLDPVALLVEIEHLQDQLWQQARLEMPQISKPESVQAIDVEQHNEAISILELRQFIEAAGGDGESLGRDHRKGRMYRRTKHSRVAHTWRTRKDPFETVWPELKQRLEERPEMTANVLFKTLQQRYPGQYADGQLRTLQRRVRAWRMERAAELFES